MFSVAFNTRIQQGGHNMRFYASIALSTYSRTRKSDYFIDIDAWCFMGAYLLFVIEVGFTFSN